MIDSQGRIVFDSSDDVDDVQTSKTRKKDDAEADEDEYTTDMTRELSRVDEEDEDAEEAENDTANDVPIDLGALGARFFPDLSILDELDICPSLKTFELGNPSGSMDIPFLKAPEDWRDQDKDKSGDPSRGDHSGMFIDGDNVAGFDDDDDLGLGAFDMDADVAFGEGGEAWAREAALEPQMRVFDAGAGGDDEGDMLEQDTGDYVVSMKHAPSADKMHEDILGYFDQALQKNWTSAEHWRIRKIKDSSKPAGPAKTRKEKEPFEIDFNAPMDQALADALYTQASSNSAISMPKKDWKTKSRNLLPDDRHFTSKSLLSLFLKPKARLSSRRVRSALGSTGADKEVREGEMDEAFWASQKDPMLQNPGDDTAMPQGDYDANFFQDDALPFAGGMDDDDDLEFADARDHFSPGPEGVDLGMTEGVGMTAILNGETMAGTMGAFGTQLVTSTRRVRPDYVQYARVAKKVDVRRLKEELWKGMAFEKLDSVSDPDFPPYFSLHTTNMDQDANASRLLTPPPTDAEEDQQVKAEEDKTLKFTEVMNDLQRVYPKPMMEDISTSYCFICLLHLANEKGLVIEKTPELTELAIRKDWTAEIAAPGE
jgi:condensin complex subunit 2